MLLSAIADGAKDAAPVVWSMRQIALRNRAEPEKHGTRSERPRGQTTGWAGLGSPAVEQWRVLDNVERWALADENIRLVVLTGSAARGWDAVNELSDLDIELYARDTSPLLGRRDWYQQFGHVLVVEELEDPEWHPTRLIYYVDGKIDFMIADVEATREGIAYERPFRALVDKDGLGARLRRAISPDAQPPTPAEFETCINWFYAAALMCAKCLVRDEPWMAKYRDWDLKEQLLQMIVWDHRSRYGWNYDTWHRGVHMRQWMDRDIVTSIGECWADFSVRTTAAALSASVALFDAISRRTAIALGMDPFPSEDVRQEVDRLLHLVDS
jgi:aminoglycoside 6-adenylyltransferase